MNIYLIGMPGSGKTTVGKSLAQKLAYTFVDLDAQIERNALMFIDEIFDKYGEQTFRKLETEALIEVKSCDQMVVSTGGGIVTNNENKEHFNGVVVYLNTELDVIEKRIKNDFPRPLLQQQSLDQLFNKRMMSYIFFADVIVDNDHQLEKTVETIISRLKEEGYLK
ncbi:Shikimate kinase [Paracholeplasma brassicae]|jgi:shikimate kinase|uniref:Shikimate kinase n=1 Tax=Acholeplasma brassicae TaxID=61635 RepID=U4KNZ8_9MOLU|nr:shikimate kinase [Paracholeplasma brassicae]CCV66026.1 Shikimate kinase [Paracholeplasma brassicae]